MTDKSDKDNTPDTNSFDDRAIRRVRDLLQSTPESVGPYRILERIGGGGMGEVFHAEQRSPIRREVALKFIKLGMDTKQVIARFEAERQALAMMDHPHIAKVYDAGTDDTGRPYFVMEYVKGKPITEYADINLLSIEDRLSLFEQVCQAVQHAHHKGVIHRDLKPGNVLVSTQDGRAFSKVIDFGIAKAISQRLTDVTLFTQFDQFIGTPQYMSPEQAEGSLDIDTRSDVYSLGVLLYELLTGSTPFTRDDFRAIAFEQLKRLIIEVDPPKPSTRISSLAFAPSIERLSRPLPPKNDKVSSARDEQQEAIGDNRSTLPSLSKARALTPQTYAKKLRGELDWIVMKALEKDRKRRYATPSQLADDVQAYLLGAPVEAAPPSTFYQFQKFARRHRGQFVAASAISSALLLGTAGATWGYVQASRLAKVERIAKEQSDLARTAAEHALDNAELEAYIANLGLAQSAMENNNYYEARQFLANCPESKRGWEWKFLNKRAQSIIGKFAAKEYGFLEGEDGFWVILDSKRLQTYDRDGRPKSLLVSCEDENEKLDRAAFSSDGKRILLTGFRTERTEHKQLWLRLMDNTGISILSLPSFEITWKFDYKDYLAFDKLLTRYAYLDIADRAIVSGELAELGVPRRVEIESMHNLYRITKDGNYLLEPSGSDGLRVSKLTNSSLVEIGSVQGKFDEFGAMGEQNKYWAFDGSANLVSVFQISETGCDQLYSIPSDSIPVVSADGKKLGVGHGSELKVVSAEDGSQLFAASIEGKSSWWYNSISSAGKYLQHKTDKRVWNTESGVPIAPSKWRDKLIATSSDDSKLLIDVPDRGISAIWDSEETVSGTIYTDNLKNDYYAVWSGRFNRDATLMTYSSEDGVLFVKPENIGAEIEQFPPLDPAIPPFLPQRVEQPSEPKDRPFNSVRLTSIGGNVALSVENPSSPNDRKVIASSLIPGESSFAFSPDGSRLVIAKNDQTIRFFETRTWRQLASLSVPGHYQYPDRRVTAIYFLDGGDQLCVQFNYGSFTILNYMDSKLQNAEWNARYKEDTTRLDNLEKALLEGATIEEIVQRVKSDSAISFGRKWNLLDALLKKVAAWKSEAEKYFEKNAMAYALAYVSRKTESPAPQVDDSALPNPTRKQLQQLVDDWSPSAEDLNGLAWEVAGQENLDDAQYRDAIRLITFAIDLDPNWYYINTLGVLQYRIKDYHASRETLERVIASEEPSKETGAAFIPELTHTKLRLAMALFQLGEQEQARQIMKEQYDFYGPKSIGEKLEGDAKQTLEEAQRLTEAEVPVVESQ